MSSPTDYATTSRASARAILDQPPFAVTHHPGLLQRVTDDVSHWIGSVFRWIAAQFRHFLGHPVAHGAHVAFGGWSRIVLVAAAVAVTAAFAWVVVLALRRRSHPVDESTGAVTRSARARRVDALLEEARRAWQRGDLDGALRLRFEAGLERLEDRGVVEGRATLTTSALSSQLHSAAFDELATVHTNVAYGGVHATDDEVSTAFERWPDVAEAGRSKAGAPT